MQCMTALISHVLIVELQRPEGPPSGAPYSYRREKETHELIFSWLSWPAALLSMHDDDDDGGGVAQHGGHAINNRLTKTCSLGLLRTSLILDSHFMIN